MANPQDVIARFKNAGQGQVFRFWDDLSAAERDNLLSQAAEIDLGEVDTLVAKYVKGSDDSSVNLDGLTPAPYVKRPESGGDELEWQDAFDQGEEALRRGEVGAFVVAGGQGTRLGYDGPKGTFPATPVKEKSLFRVFAEKILAAQKRYGHAIPWFIMTSHANHKATVEFFAEHGNFGLKDNQVRFFTQGRMPAVDGEGKILLSSKSEIAMSPDGHGGSLRALVRSGAVAHMKELGIRALSYFQVDNPLVQVIDPAFIGFHLSRSSEMSSKMIPKAYPLEKVGHFCIQGDRMVVIEYSDMPEEMQEETLDNGELRYNAGSIAIHMLDPDFVERVGGGQGDVALPFHRANKKIPTVDDAGNEVKPEEPNGVKFEMFVFDALPFAKNPVVIETVREDDFSPIKNAEGKDSPQSSKEDQIRQWTRWANAAGLQLKTDETGLPPFKWEVSPLYATSANDFVARWKNEASSPEIKEGTYLE